MLSAYVVTSTAMQYESIFSSMELPMKENTICAAVKRHHATIANQSARSAGVPRQPQQFVYVGSLASNGELSTAMVFRHTLTTPKERSSLSKREPGKVPPPT